MDFVTLQIPCLDPCGAKGFDQVFVKRAVAMSATLLEGNFMHEMLLYVARSFSPRPSKILSLPKGGE